MMGSAAAGLLVALNVARELDEARDVTFENEMQARAVGAAFVHQGAHRDVPAVVHFAEDIFGGDAHIAEKSSLNSDSPVIWRSGRTSTPGDFISTRSTVRPLCFAAVASVRTTSSHQSPTPAVAGPDFLAVHEVVIAVEDRFCVCRPARSEPAFGLGKTLAPDFFGAENFRNEALLLRFGAVGDDRRLDECRGLENWPWAEPRRAPFLPRTTLAASARRCGLRIPWARKRRPTRPSPCNLRCHARR